MTFQEETDNRFRRVVEAAPNAMLLVDGTQTIVFANRSGEELFGYDDGELLGKKLDILLPERFRRPHAQHTESFFARPAPRSMGTRELSGQRKDGAEIPLDISLNYIETAEGNYTLASIMDPTDRHVGEERKQRLVAIIDSSDDAIFAHTLDGVITTWNRGAERIFGYTAEEAVGQPITMLVPAHLREEESFAMDRLKKDEILGHFETVHKCKGGREIDVSVAAAPIRNASNSVVGVSRIARDITSAKRRERALARAKEAAESAIEELESFSYSVAHDLRAPLRSIDGFSQALIEDCQDKLDDNGRKYLGFVRESAQQMARLIDDLLALSRVTRTELRTKVVDLSTLAKDVIDRLRRGEPHRSVDVTIQESVRAEGDPGLLTVLLENLLGNAWKFTRKCDRAFIEFGMTPDDGLVTYFVRDNGVGFNMAFANKLFGVFQRLHSQSEFEGTGVGLATVQRIARRHGGRVWANAKVDGGATFFFTLGEIDLCPISQ